MRKILNYTLNIILAICLGIIILFIFGKVYMLVEIANESNILLK